MGKNINWGKISIGEEYKLGKNINWGRISSGEEYQVGENIKLGRISSGEEYKVRKNIEWGRISSWEEYQVGEENLVGNYRVPQKGYNSYLILARHGSFLCRRSQNSIESQSYIELYTEDIPGNPNVGKATFNLLYMKS